MRLSSKIQSSAYVVVASSLFAAACSGGTTDAPTQNAPGGDGDGGDGDGDGGDGDGDTTPPIKNDPVLDPLSPTTDSLDLSTVGTQSANWCQLPAFSPQGFLPLDQQTLAETLAEYTVGWMTPLHDSLGSLEEQSLFNTTFEMVWASFRTDCNWNDRDDLTFGDDGLLDDQNRTDAYQEVLDFVLGAAVVEGGDALRLAFHDCADCAEPLGAAPFYVNARQSTDGVLVLEVEPFAGTVSQTYYITPEVFIAQVDLTDLSQWVQQVDSDARSGDTLWPDAAGTVTAIGLRTSEGIWASIGVAGLSFDSQIESEDNVHFSTSTPCIGMHATTHHPTGLARASTFLGNLQAAVPGTLNCQSDDCGAAETTQDWVYAVNGFSLLAEQPPLSSDGELLVWMSADSSASARLGSETFAQWQVGSEQASGGAFQAGVDERGDGFLVTFEPALNLRGAMAISKFSDQFRLSLPTWLEDEIFDINFGGDPTASVLVPYREQCNPDGEDPPEPERRQVEIVSGTFNAQVGSGTKTALAGQCAGATLLDESELTLTSDWADVGFVCE